MRVVFMGSPEFAALPLKYLMRSPYPVAAVYTQPDRPAGRGRGVRAAPAAVLARELGLRLVQPVSLKDSGVQSELAGLNPDVLVVAAFGQILPPPVLALPRYGCLNIHPSLLPRYRGASPVASAILAGDEFTGVSIMLLDKGMDTGPVLAQAQVPVLPLDTAGTLTAKLSLIGSQLLLDVLPRWISGEIKARPQDDSRAIYCRPIAKDAGVIDWQLSAVEIWRRVRAYQPWPGCHTVWQGRRLKIISAIPLPDVGAAAGEVVALNGSAAGFGVGTGDGTLGVTGVQLEGKRAVPASEFIRGQRDFIGGRL